MQENEKGAIAFLKKMDVIFLIILLLLILMFVIVFIKKNKFDKEEAKQAEERRVAYAKKKAEYNKLPKHLCIDGKEYIAHYYSLNPILAEPKGQVFEVVDNVSVPKKCSEQK